MEQDKLAQWVEMVERIKVEVKPLVERERRLRQELFGELFPSPLEGTNYVGLANGWRLKGVYKLDRKLDEAALPAVRDTLATMDVNADTLVDWKPSLKTTAYKNLPDEARKVFDEALTMRPASPVMELVPPKESK